MKIYAINGSPRKKWNTSTMLQHFLDGAKSTDQSVETELIDLNYRGCISCYGCKIPGKAYETCVINDDLKPLLQMLYQADGVVLGSPIYLADMTSFMRGSMSLELMEAAFAWAREMNPKQPLTAGPWSFPDGVTNLDEGVAVQEIEDRALALSDIISFHYYGSLKRTQKIVARLKALDRPLVITEWLHRIFGNTVEDMLPYFISQNISCYHWGLVTGKTQTNEPWELLKGIEGLDISKWQHDLFYPDLTPYDPSEINVFKKQMRKQ